MLGKPRLGRQPLKEVLGLLFTILGGAVLVIFVPGWFWVVLVGLALIGGGLFLIWR